MLQEKYRRMVGYTQYESLLVIKGMGDYHRAMVSKAIQTIQSSSKRRELRRLVLALMDMQSLMLSDIVYVYICL